jgi:hypothetical protein
MIRRLLRMYRTYAQIPNNISLPRYILLKPFIFEALSTVLQLHDRRRLMRIDDAGLKNPFLKRVFAYNAAMTKSRFTRTRRTEKCYVELTRPYARLPYLTSGETDVQISGPGLENERLLIIGPRNVHELLLARLYGYRWKNIFGADLYSTNRRIVPMDMNALAFRANTFDAVSMHSTLGYSPDVRLTLQEVSRVLKPTGRLVFQSDFSKSPQAYPDYAGEALSGERLHGYLRELGFHLTGLRTTYVFDQGAYGTDYLFSVQKLDSRKLGFDTIPW